MYNIYIGGHYSAKALGGGVPIGSMCCKEKFNVFSPGDHASTYGAAVSFTCFESEYPQWIW